MIKARESSWPKGGSMNYSLSLTNQIWSQGGLAWERPMGPAPWVLTDASENRMQRDTHRFVLWSCLQMPWAPGAGSSENGFALNTCAAEIGQLLTCKSMTSEIHKANRFHLKSGGKRIFDQDMPTESLNKGSLGVHCIQKGIRITLERNWIWMKLNAKKN